jgi:nitroimidazol reductase NimA-like FMN-containing flavoprotein (pyridoxamine 5'-phosphate oxidase superfamily)
VIVDEGLELLSEDQARDLLATAEVGRIGVTIGALPAIFPVNYRLIDGSIVFRTAAGSKMSAAAEGAVVAFEVKVLEAQLEPWADGHRTTIVRIEPTFISGRRIVHDPPPSGT